MKYNSDSITTNVVNFNGVDRSYTLRWGIKSVNLSTRKSVIGFSLRCNTNNPEADTVEESAARRFIYSLNVNGTPVNWGDVGNAYEILEDGWVYIYTDAFTGKQNGLDDYTMAHDANGAATLNLELTIDIDTTLHFEASGSWELPILKTSYYLDVPDAYIGETANINVHYSNASWCTITYEFGGFSGNVTPWETNETVISWEIPPEFYAYVPNSTVGYGLLTCTFYNNNAEVLTTATATFGVKVRKETNLPILNPIAIDTDPLTVAATQDNTILVKHRSDVKLSPGATAQNGADIIYQEITYNVNKVTAYVPFTLENIENPTFTFMAADSRGFVSKTTVTSSLLNYVELTCHISKYQLDASGSMEFEIEGNYFNSDFIATDNTLAVEYRYRELNGTYGNWIAATPAIYDNTYRANVTVTGLEYGKIYELEARAIDKVSTINSEVVKLVSKTVFDWGENDFRFTVPVKPTGGVVLGADETVRYSNGSTETNLLSHNSFGIKLGDSESPSYNTDVHGQHFRFYPTEDFRLYSDKLTYTNKDYVDLVGLVNALTTLEELSVEITETTNNYDCWGEAYLVGTHLYLYVGVDAGSSGWSMDVKITHNGKILNMANNLMAVGVNTDDNKSGLYQLSRVTNYDTFTTALVKPSYTVMSGYAEMTFIIPIAINPYNYNV